MEMAVGISVGVAGLLVAAIALAALGRARREGRELGQRVASEVEPYLRRKAAEAGIESSSPVWTSRHSATERVEHSAKLASQLLDREKGVPPEASNTALAQTVPASGETRIDTTAPQSPKARNPKG